MKDTVCLYHETREFRRGLGSLFYAFGGVVVVAAATVAPIATPLRLFGWCAGLLMVGILALHFETSVADGLLRLEVRPIWRRRIDLRAIVSVEPVLSDFQAAWFGGWNARDNTASAFMAELEGDRSFGRTAIRVHLGTGQFCQVGTFRPAELTAAIEAARHPA